MTHISAEYPIEHLPEPNQPHRIVSGGDYGIDDGRIPKNGETPLLATIYAGVPDQYETDTLPEEDPRQLQLIDMRGAQRHPQSGAKMYAGLEWSEHADYLIIQPSSFSRDQKRGWKVLGKGSEFIFGRDSKQSVGHFDLPPTISRRHMRVISTPEGVIVTDLNSSNGTGVREYAHQVPKKPNVIGSKVTKQFVSVSELPKSHEFTAEEERIIAANINIMLDGHTGGMGAQMASESMGGNAGFIKIDGKAFSQSASNGYADERGRIIEFANPQNASKKVTENREKLIEICFVNAHPAIKVVNGQVTFDHPTSWARSNRVVTIYIEGKKINLEDEVESIHAAVRLLVESAKRYNAVPDGRI